MFTDSVTVAVNLQWCLGVIGLFATVGGLWFVGLTVVRLFSERYEVTRRADEKQPDKGWH